MDNLINHVKECLEKTDLCESNITDELLWMEGMSGQKTRHFYNNLCSVDNVKYLEVGCWKGSSLCSAMCNNKITCLAIDNWSEFGGPKHEFINNYNKYKGKNNTNFIENDCWEIDPNKLDTKFNIYMYDGNHSEDSHFKALNHFLPCLENEFIYLVDDWNWPQVRDGTIKSIKENECKILYQKVIKTTNNDMHPKIHSQFSDWHNGISIFILQKN